MWSLIHKGLIKNDRIVYLLPDSPALRNCDCLIDPSESSVLEPAETRASQVTVIWRNRLASSVVHLAQYRQVHLTPYLFES